MEIKYEPFRHAWYVEKNGIICYVPEWAVEYIKGVESENAKLRAERDYLLMNSNPTAAELRRVRSAWKNDRDENAKLRELVRKMMRFFEDGDYCAACEKAAECDAQEEYDDDCLMRGVFHANMRELGIEVDK